MSKKKKGAALVTVIIVFMILVILGAAFINVSAADARHAIRQQNSAQSYQSARTGVEIGLKKLDAAIASVTGTTYYSDIDDLLNNTTIKSLVNGGLAGNIDGGGSYKVTFEKNSVLSANESLKIKGEGTFGNVTSTTALTIKIICPNLNPNGWINNGWIVNSGNFEMIGGPVVFKSKKNLGHPVMKSGNNATTVFKATSIHFQDVGKDYSLEVKKNAEKFTLEANLISFKTKVLIQNDNSGEMFLDVYENIIKDASGNVISTNRNGLQKEDGSGAFLPGYGVVYLPGGLWQGSTQVLTNGMYFFKGSPTDTFNIDNPSDRGNTSKFIPIPAGSDIERDILRIINRETNIGIRRETSVWSKN